MALPGAGTRSESGRVVQPSDHSPGSSVDWSALRTRPASVTSHVEARLERLIRDGELPDGARLPSERALAELLGVSRSSIREAVRELWLKGLVDRRQGHGTFVTSRTAVDEPFMRHVHDRLGEAALAVVKVMDYRSALEPAIAARAAARAGAADVARLQQLFAAFEAETSAIRSAELDAAFHHAVAEATANSLLVQVVEFSGEWLRATRREALQGRRRRAMSIASHRAVLRAIAAHDPVAAAAAMEQHIREVSAFVESRLQRNRRRVAREERT